MKCFPPKTQKFFCLRTVPAEGFSHIESIPLLQKAENAEESTSFMQRRVKTHLEFSWPGPSCRRRNSRTRAACERHTRRTPHSDYSPRCLESWSPCQHVARRPQSALSHKSSSEQMRQDSVTSCNRRTWTPSPVHARIVFQIRSSEDSIAIICRTTFCCRELS